MTFRAKIALAGLLLAITVPALALPSLPADSRIRRGTLGCGVSYYMVTNPAQKGYADIALVRRDEAPSEATMNSLDAGFFSRMGIGPGREGYVSEQDGSTVIRYRNLAFYRPQVLDSTLLRTFKQIALSRAEQAIIICGDIDPVELKKKMDIFSMLVPRILVKEAHTPDYVWEPSPAPSVLVRHSPGRALAEVNVSYSSARIPHQLMNTPQALVTEILSDELNLLLTHRLERNLRDSGIPFSGIRFTSLQSRESGSDERYGVSVETLPEHLDGAMRIVASTMAEMDSFGVKVTEFKDAKGILGPRYTARSEKLPSVGEDVERCIRHFLYGANLAPFSEQARYLSRKNVPDSVQTRHFNNFTAALMEQLANLTLRYTVPSDSIDRDETLFYYNLAYLYGSITPGGKDYSWHSRDTLGLESLPPKVKIKSERTEPITGGKLWTFSNGIQVAYKEIPGSGMFSFAYILSGGLSRIEDLREGEGGYICDILSLYDAGGLSAKAFNDMLVSNGLDIKTSIDANNLYLSGQARTKQLPFLLKTLLSIANERDFNWGEYEIYSRNESLRTIPVEERLAMMTSPGFKAGAFKAKGVLGAETCRKAECYFQERFSRMNDGILVISGDFDEAQLKKTLCRYLGGLQTAKTALPRVTSTRGSLSGSRTIEGDNAPKGLYIRMDAEYPVTSKNYFTSRLAMEYLETILTERLIPYGFSVRIKSGVEAKPQERFNILIVCTPAKEEGLPAEIGTPDLERALSAVRMGVRASAVSTVKDEDLSAWKAGLLSRADALMNTHEGAVTTLTARYSAGKDITSRYRETVTGISAADIKAFLGAMASGGRIEYIVE